jgi:hypothetical protein
MRTKGEEEFLVLVCVERYENRMMHYTGFESVMTSKISAK